MKRVDFALLILGLLSIPSYSSAELAAPTNVTATEGVYSDRIIVNWNHDNNVTTYEVWRDSYESCEGANPCEPEFILWGTTNGVSKFFEVGGDILPYGQIFEYRIKACGNDEITNEQICSDFSLPAYGYVLEDAPTYAEVHPPNYNVSCAAVGACGAGAGGGGIFGDIIKSKVIGYHLDGITAKGLQVYMPVTHGFKALKGAQEYVRSFAPNLAEFVREGFDSLEKRADENKDGFLYQIGTRIFPILGKIAEKTMVLIGQEEYIANAYSKTTISVVEFKKLEHDGVAIAPKTVKEIEKFKQEMNLIEVFN